MDTNTAVNLEEVKQEEKKGRGRPKGIRNEKVVEQAKSYILNQMEKCDHRIARLGYEVEKQEEKKIAFQKQLEDLQNADTIAS